MSNLDFTVNEGEIRGLIGPNGSGKTTFFNVISGYYRASSGSVFFRGEEITNRKPHVIAKTGIIRTFQTTFLFTEMSVLDNVYAGFHLRVKSGILSLLARTKSNREENRLIKEQCMEILDYMKIADLRDELVENLPYGHQRRLAIAIGLAANPKMLLLDETLTGMNQKETDDMVEQIRKIRDDIGTTIIIIEHNTKAILGLCDRITVLNYGIKLCEGAPTEVINNEDVIEAYLGAERDI